MPTAELTQQKEALRRRGICVVVPTYNNEATIGDIVERCLRQCDDLFVVNDGSTDGTARILQDRGQTIRLLTHPHNRGKGAALRTGLQAALREGFAYAITLDADGQHFPEDIPTLLRANLRHPQSIIVGQRRDLGSQPRSRGSRFANRFSNFWFAVQTGHRLPDTQSGYRLYPLRRLVGLSWLTSRYEAELELLVLASWHGVAIHSAEVGVYYPPLAYRVSHFRPALDFTRISLLNTLLCLLALVYALPRKLLKGTWTALRSLYSFLFFVLCSLLVMNPATFFICLFAADKEKAAKRTRRLIYAVFRFVMLRHGVPGVRFSVKNEHNERFRSPSVIICNHQSNLDLLVLLALSPDIVVLTKDRIWHHPLFGYFVRKAEYFPVSMDMEALLPRLRRLAESGCSIAVYPEGTRTTTHEIQRFHKGAFLIVQELKLDLLPLVQYGADLVLPKRSHHLHTGRITLEIGERSKPAARAAYGDAREVAKVCRRSMTERYDLLRDEEDRKT